MARLYRDFDRSRFHNGTIEGEFGGENNGRQCRARARGFIGNFRVSGSKGNRSNTSTSGGRMGGRMTNIRRKPHGPQYAAHPSIRISTGAEGIAEGKKEI